MQVTSQGGRPGEREDVAILAQATSLLSHYRGSASPWWGKVEPQRAVSRFSGLRLVRRVEMLSSEYHRAKLGEAVRLGLPSYCDCLRQ